MEEESFKLEAISLLKSRFERKAMIEYSDPEFKNEVTVSLKKNKDQEKIGVTLTVGFIAKVKEEVKIDLSVTYIGVFVAENVSSEAEESFLNINGPAIIFPFIREHIASLSTKAILKPILLPPIDFSKLEHYEEADKEEEK